MTILGTRKGIALDYCVITKWNNLKVLIAVMVARAGEAFKGVLEVILSFYEVRRAWSRMVARINGEKKEHLESMVWSHPRFLQNYSNFQCPSCTEGYKRRWAELAQNGFPNLPTGSMLSKVFFCESFQDCENLMLCFHHLQLPRNVCFPEVEGILRAVLTETSRV